MAAKESKFSAEIDDNFLSCTICSERYKNPKLLSCLHSFCEPCLGKLADKSGVVTCPICRRSHQLPDSGVAGIGGNQFINELVHQFRKREEGLSKSRKCEGCGEGECVNHCVECDVDMCGICARSHAKFRFTKSHRLMTIKEYQSAKSDDLASVQPPVYCTNHPNNEVKFYCDSCDVAICHECTALDHPRPEHKYRYLKDAAAEYSKDLTEVIDKVKVKEDEASHSKAVVMETAESLDSCYQTEGKKMKEHIQKTVDDVTRMIRENGDKLLGELKDEYDRRKVNLNAQLKELEFAESDMSNAREYAEKLMHYGNATQLMSARKGIATQMEELLRMETKIDPTETDYMEFKPCDDFCGTKTVGMLCTSVITNACALVDVPEFVRVDEDITITLTTGAEQRKVAHEEVEVEAVLKKPVDNQEEMETTNNGDGTWSLKTRPKITGNHGVSVSVSKKPVKGSPVTINVIPQKGLICKFGQSGSGVGQLSGPWGVMVTRGGNVRVCDSGNKRLQTFTQHGQHRSITTFSNISTTVSPNFSAVSEDGSIFTTDSSGCQVIVHDENGRVMRCFGKGVINSPYGIAIHPVNGRVYVVDLSGHCIRIYNQDGQLYKSFGSKGAHAGQLSCPVGVIIDSAGKVFVADQCNHRIQVFDAEGEYLYSFGSQGSGDNQMYHPHGISLDSEGNVYVCDHSNSRVMKYESDGQFIGRIDSDDNRVERPIGVCVTDDKPFGKVIVVSNKGYVQVFAQ